MLTHAIRLFYLCMYVCSFVYIMLICDPINPESGFCFVLFQNKYTNCYRLVLFCFDTLCIFTVGVLNVDYLWGL